MEIYPQEHERKVKGDEKFKIKFDQIKELLQKKEHERVIDVLLHNFVNPDPETGWRWYQINGLKCYFSFREQWIYDYGSWALPPTVDQLYEIKDIINDRKILEIGAGSGLWAALFRCVGLDIIVTDSKNEHNLEYINVEQLTSYEAMKKYGSLVGCLFVSWGRGYPTKKEFGCFKGDLVITIGEPKEGCTNNGYLEDLENDNSWELIKSIDIPQWEYINDCVSIYRKIIPQ